MVNDTHTRRRIDHYTATWWVRCYIWYIEEPGWAATFTP